MSEDKNTNEFIKLMDTIDYKQFNEFLFTISDMDIGQYVRRICEERGSIEGDSPSDLALAILRELVEKYPKKTESC